MVSNGIYAQQRYDPYGQVRWQNGSLPTDRQYTGQRREAPLGIYDYRARFYSPRVGRFLSADTLVPNPANPQSFNRYTYVYNRPLVYIDDDGHFPWLVIPVLVLTAVLCTRSTMDPVVANEVRYVESLHSTAATDLDALITMFTTDQLRGDTVEDRFSTILDYTRKIPGLYTAGGWGETGLNTDFQDGKWYEQYWGGETAQIGHFLTAVAFGYNACRLPLGGELLKLAVGHEMVGDPWWPMQYMAATSEARSLFDKAVDADIAGNYAER